ncbi:hypothetical protein GIB67_032310 [Kingdonia uniflora]|uniref:Uncharacterized protein n=1 Tax=Kingdonia uniflora TaxID=39325 RepID=A0A7J7MX66_9MAGN|nr:hypothetical protein GIB67_032310 [Kingdonia uniflora]
MRKILWSLASVGLFLRTINWHEDQVPEDSSAFCLLGASHLFEGFYNGLMALPILGSITTFEVMA